MDITKPRREKFVCPVCEKVFIYAVGSGRRPKYCSEECRRQRNSLHVLKKYHNTDSTDDWVRMYKMKHEPCIRCEFSGKVSLHDIIPVSEGGDKNSSRNRIPLCPNCHSTLHKNIWRIWDIENKLEQNPNYSTQYWLTQLLKSENYEYLYKNESRNR